MRGPDELRRRLRDAFDGERPRPGVVDEIVQKAQAGASPRRAWHHRAAPLALALAVPLATAGVAVAIGVTHHPSGSGNTGGAAPTNIGTTPSPSPLPTFAAPAHFIPWAPIPPGDANQATPTPLPVPPGTPPCRAAQLEAAQVGQNGATGHLDTPITLRNRGTAACTLDGYADLRIVDSGGRVLAQAVGSTGRGTFFDSGSPQPVLMQPGTPALPATPDASGFGSTGQALVNVEWADCKGPIAQTATLDLPASGGRLVVPFVRKAPYSPACDGQPGFGPYLGRGPFLAIPPQPVRYKLEAQIAAPAQARAGTTLTYYVTLSNRGPVAYTFNPCPVYFESFSGVKSDTMFALNCAPAGTLAVDASVTFEMRIDIPATLSGPAELTWNPFGLEGAAGPASASIDIIKAGG